MSKNNIMTWLISGAIAIILLMVISKLIFSGINGLNEGQFRVTDAILTSTAIVEDINSDTSKWEINISQNNRLALLIQGMDSAKISKVEIDKIKVIRSPRVGEIYISEPRTKETKSIENSKSESVAVYVDKRQDGSNLIEIDILNKDIVKNYGVPEEINELRHDGTAISIANKTIEDIQFKISFNINITQDNGKENKCKVTLNLPDHSLITNGQVVTRLSLSDFKFRI